MKRRKSPEYDTMPNQRRIATDAICAGEDSFFDSPVFPIWQTATFAFRDYQEIINFNKGKTKKLKYGRYGNPLQKVLEDKLAVLEKAEGALVFASGMNAITTVLFALLKPGDHAIYCSSCYRNTMRFFSEILPSFGIFTTCVPPSNIDTLERAIKQSTRLIFYEIPTNIFLRVTDLEKLVKVVKAHSHIIIVIDSTFASPFNLRPIEYGVDLVIHSLTKYLGGHDDLLGGCICGNSYLLSQICAYRDTFGGICDPHNSFLCLRSLKTFVIRMERLNLNGLTIAQFLEKHSKVSRVFYPGLASHPDHKIAKTLMMGCGSVIYFEVKGGLPAAKHFIESLRIPRIATNFGGVHTLIEPVSLLTYGKLSKQQRANLGVGENMIRLSVGLEDVKDLILDLQRALNSNY